jgi:signal transduction histidine kinase
MTTLIFFVVWVNTVVCFAAAVAVAWRNRYIVLGPLFALTLGVMGAWAAGFSFYYYPLSRDHALFAAYLTLTFSISAHAAWFHTLCALADRLRRMKWIILASYGSAVLLLILMLRGELIVGLRACPFMHHYVHYNRTFYPWLMAYLCSTQFVGAALVWRNAQQQVGYRRSQLMYFLGAWLILFLTTSSVIIPLEYNVNIPPFGFFVLPLNLIFLVRVMNKARLADYNVVIARVFLYLVTMIVIAVVSLIFIGGVTLIAPQFMNEAQLIFSFTLAMAIGMGLTVSLPKLLPRAERLMQERMFGTRYGYQDALSGLVRELSTLPTIDQVLATVATTLHSQMQVSRVLVLVQDALSGDLRLQAESGLGPQDDVDALVLHEDAAIMKWLQDKQDELVRDEMMRREPPRVRQLLEEEMNLLKVALCVPMILDGRLVGLIGLGEKLNRDMFFASDLRVLETLATEVALAVKYRRIEDEALRKNRLVELGTIAAGVAHEIRNPLASIKTFAQLMPERVDDPEFRNEFGKLVLKDVDRITKVIESMLAFARPAQVNIQEQPANDLVEEAILLVQPRLKAKRIELTRAFHGNPTIKVDKHQILQVLVNLLGNAADALQERGKVRVATGVTQLDISASGNGSRNSAVIEVSDNGPGIPAAVRGRLFDPFFTTKKEGTGLGLSISQKIVRDHGGTITVSSVEGKGTTFQINLPVK